MANQGKVEGVVVKLAKNEVILQAIEKNGLKPGANITENIKILSGFYAQKPDDQKVDCDQCGGISTIEDTVCPYCGLDDSTPATTVEENKPVTPTPAPEAGKKGKKSKAVTPEPSTALARVSSDSDMICQGTEEDLDASVEGILRAKSGVANSYWLLGKLIGENHQKALWKARKDSETGKPKYTSFNAFCDKELGLSHQHAYNLMDIARAFTESDVTKFGTTKLGLVLQVPDEERPKLLEAAGSLSKRELEKKVKDTKAKQSKETGKATRETGRKDVSKAVEAKAKNKPEKAAPSDTITVASIEGTKTLKLLATAAKKGEAEKPAKALDQGPWTRMDLENNVEMIFKVKTNANGELLLQVVTRRKKG